MQPGLGAHKSPLDFRTFKHDVTLGAPVTQGGVTYNPEDILHQHTVGVCTSISLIQNAQKALSN